MRPMLNGSHSIAEQFFQLGPRRFFARINPGFWRPRAAGEFKIFAEISHRLFQHRFGPAFAALLRPPRIVADAIQAYAQVGAAFHADFSATGIAGEGPGFTAIMTMSCHAQDPYLRPA